MAEAPDGRNRSSSVPNQCLILEPPQKHEPVHANDQPARFALANGRCVLVVGETLDGPQSLLPEDMRTWMGPSSEFLECMGEPPSLH